MTAAPQSALLSIHDVMPETLPPVLEIVNRMNEHGLPPALLLVCPGVAWNRSALDQLKDLEDRGHPLAGHGWQHRISDYGGLYHRLHSLIISRGVAEHLAMAPDAIAGMIQRGYDWFAEHGFDPPRLYVPPAWAMGPLRRSTLQHLPYRWYEDLRGIYDSEHAVRHPLPLVGFEADTALRALLVRGFNALNRTWAARSRRALRVAIHPRDLTLLLANDLLELIARDLHCLALDDLAG